jgi:hypothetical protein
MDKKPKIRKKVAPYDGKSSVTLVYRKEFLESFIIGTLKLPEMFRVTNLGVLPEYFIEILELTFDYMKLKKNEAHVVYEEDDDHVMFTILPYKIKKKPKTA